jgi:uncharacterized protein YdhG (YjbR/CyaY superfamily)
MKALGTDMNSESLGPEKTVDGYISSAPKRFQSSLKELRRAIKVAAPEADETIRYRIPSYKQGGYLVFFAAFKNHCSFIVPGKIVMKKFKRELEPYDISGATIHFTEKNSLPSSLVKKIVKARIEEDEETSRRKQRAKSNG